MIDLSYFIIESLSKYDIPDNTKFTDYPKAGTTNAKKAIEYKNTYKDEVKGGTIVGWTRANQLANREAISFDIVKRIAMFNRHRENSNIDPKYKGEPWKDRGYIAWLIWGGDEMVDWAMRTVDKHRK